MKIWKTGLFCLATFLASNLQADPFVQQFESGNLNWASGQMEALGIGIGPDKYAGSPRARVLAVRAAKTDALRNLLEQVQGVKVASQTLTKDFAVESDLIRTMMTGVVRGASMVGKPQYMDDGSVEVTMAINYKKKVAPTIMKVHLKASPETISLQSQLPEQPNDEGIEDADLITGLVIDAIGLGLRTALAPKILDEDGHIIYSGHLVAVEKQADIVAYDTNVADAMKLARVGTNPMSLRALKVLDMTNIVISNKDAAKIMKQSGLHDVLRNAKVAFAL